MFEKYNFRNKFHNYILESRISSELFFLQSFISISFYKLYSFRNFYDSCNGKNLHILKKRWLYPFREPAHDLGLKCELCRGFPGFSHD